MGDVLTGQGWMRVLFVSVRETCPEATPIEFFEQTLRMIRPSTSAHDTRTVSSWRTAAASHPDIAILRSVTFISGRGWRSIQGSKLLANNPITWSCGSGGRASEPDEHRGGHCLRTWILETIGAGSSPPALACASGTCLQEAQMSLASRFRLLFQWIVVR
mmetsp:Transcript_92971/g.299223  ORF Transcript_92971/g.299223 Transcript_92971/m.299223 type:complete len:160 (+) Transcript_92971:120-599(+)